MRTLRFLLRKEFLQIRRDHAMLRLLIAMPIIQLLLLSNAATFEIRGTALYLIDEDRSSVSRGLVDRLVASGRFEVAEASGSMERANASLLSRRVSTILHVPADFERDLVRTGVAPVQLVFNAEDGAAAGVLRSYATRIIGRYSAELGREIRPRLTAGDAGVGGIGEADETVGAGGAGGAGAVGADGARAAGAPVAAGGAGAVGGADEGGGGASAATAAIAAAGPAIDLHTRAWYNPELDYIDFMVPGILVVLVTIIATTVGAMNIVREKEIGTLEQLNVTPITRGEFIASKLIPFWLIALGELAVGLVIGAAVFSIPMRGSLALVFGAAAIYLVAALGIGLWISTIAATQQQAMFLSFAINMIYLLMSGLFTPILSMPVWAQWITQLSPLKHFVVIMRAILVKGAGPADIALPLTVLAVFGTTVLALAVRRYSKTAG